MPLPKQIGVGEGELQIDPGFKVVLEGYKESRLNAACARFYDVLARKTGITVWNNASGLPRLRVVTTGPSKPVQSVDEDEAYRLEVTHREAVLTAANPLGVLHGLQTFLQLVVNTKHGFVVPAVSITDEPRFRWRGLMIDTSRHFIPVPVIERALDGLEAVKMNVFHWHLSDDQGFRAESRLFPLLQEKGSDGLYYTQEQMAEVVRYAWLRGIRVVPELDMPGHVTAWLPGYPELGSGPGPYSIERKWGIFNPALDPTRESTYTFVDRLIGELTAIFPDAYFHIGGDECNGKEWNANPQIRQFMQSHNLSDTAALQAYFSLRVQQLVMAHGKIPAGWDEILQPSTDKRVLIQSWHGEKALLQAVGQGNDVILSKGYYLNMNSPAGEHYLVDPLGGNAASLKDEQKKHVLGGEAAVWTEYISSETIDTRIWPRNAAIAERLWSPAQATQDVEAMYRRLNGISIYLQYVGTQHQTQFSLMLERIVGGDNIEPLETLAGALKPVMAYERPKGGAYNAFDPLNHLADALPAESMTAHRFGALAESLSKGAASSEEHSQARQQLLLWQNNDATLEPRLQGSPLAAELIPQSQGLKRVAEIGIEALDLLESRKKPAGDWAELAAKELAAASKPQAATVLVLTDPIGELVKAAQTPPQR